jgi:alcohol dehydrogenase class IV
MVAPFTYVAYPTRVVFGPNRLRELGPELERLGVRRALLLSTSEQVDLAERGRRELGDVAGGIFARAAMHTPVDITEEALKDVQSLGADGFVALGGGSTIGLGKALALRTDLPLLAVPTTYAGSEMTTILGETKDGRKVTQRTPKVLPEVVIYDVELTLSLPPSLSVTSGLNALAHAVEALYAHDTNPIITLMAEDGIAALGRSLPRIIHNPVDVEARADAQYGAWLCATCLGVTAMALHHKVCHVLGGSFNLPHAQTHTVMLPHATAYNAPATPEAMRRIARALGTANAANGIFDLARSLAAPTSLWELGMPEAGIETAVREVMQDQYWNPRPLKQDAMRAMLTRAWNGESPKEE